MVRKRSMRVRESSADKLFTIVNTAFLVFFFVIVLYPLVYILSSSFSSAQKVVQNKVWLYPVEPDVEAYRAVFRNRDILIVNA